jgi:hypothetical protein
MLLSAPGNVKDFEADTQRQQWAQHLSDEIDQAIAGISGCVPSPQYVNPAIVDVSAFQRTPIHWPGFPKLAYAEFPTRQEAYAAVDQPSVVKGKKLTGGRLLQDEYLEWFIHRDGNGKIVAVDFTTETQEYWTFLFSQSKDLAARKYSEILGVQVQVADISDAAGRYNPFNRFNTTDGIIHLIQRNNTLPAELDIAAQATRPRIDGAGQITTDVVSCSHCGSPGGLGEAGRNSDPTIAQSVNGVAATGSLLTIPDPVGLYIQGLDTTGWTGPGGIQPAACWAVSRGNPAVRASLIVPAGHTLDEFQIGGISITYAGQIADKISVFLTAAFGAPNAVPLPPPAPCAAAVPAAVTTLSLAEDTLPAATRRRSR